MIGFGNLCILLMTPSKLHFALSICLVLGLILSSQAKKYGFIASLGLLIAAFLFYLPASLNLWEVGLVSSIVLNLLIAALTNEEINDLLYAVQAESRVCQRQINQADEAFNSYKSVFNNQREELISQIEALQHRCAQDEVERKTLSEDRVGIQQELAKLQQERNEFINNDTLKVEQLKTAEKKIHALEIQAAGSQEIELLKETVKQRDQEIFNLQFQLNSALEDHRSSLCLNKEAQSEVERFQELYMIHEELSHKAQEEQILQQAVQQEMNEHIETLTREKELLETMLKKLQIELENIRIDEKEAKMTLDVKENKFQSLQNNLQELQRQLQDSEEKFGALFIELQEVKERQPVPEAAQRRAEAMYLQLRQQFAEKSCILDETRRELFHAQEQVLKYQKEAEELNLYGSGDMEEKLYKYITRIEKYLQNNQRNFDQEIDQLHALIKELI